MCYASCSVTLCFVVVWYIRFLCRHQLSSCFKTPIFKRRPHFPKFWWKFQHKSYKMTKQMLMKTEDGTICRGWNNLPSWIASANTIPSPSLRSYYQGQVRLLGQEHFPDGNREQVPGFSSPIYIPVISCQWMAFGPVFLFFFPHFLFSVFIIIFLQQDFPLLTEWVFSKILTTTNRSLMKAISLYAIEVLTHVKHECNCDIKKLDIVALKKWTLWNSFTKGFRS